MLGIILLLLFLFSRPCFFLFDFFCPQPWRKRAVKHAEGSWRGCQRGSVKALLMRLCQHKNTQGAGLEKPKNISPGKIPNPRISRILSVYIYYICICTRCYPPGALSTSLLLRGLPSLALSHLNTYAYLIWHGFDFGFDFSLCLGCSPRNR